MKNVFADLTIHLTLTGSIESHPAATAIYVYVYPVDEPDVLEKRTLQDLLGPPDPSPAQPGAAPLEASDLDEHEHLAPGQPQPDGSPMPAPPAGKVSYVAILPDLEQVPAEAEQPEPPIPVSGQPSPVVPHGPRGGIRKTCPVCGIPISMYAKTCKSHRSNSFNEYHGPVEPARAPDAPVEEPALSAAKESTVPASLRPRDRDRDRDVVRDYSDLDLSDLHGSRIA